MFCWWQPFATSFKMGDNCKAKFYWNQLFSFSRVDSAGKVETRERLKEQSKNGWNSVFLGKKNKSKPTI